MHQPATVCGPLWAFSDQATQALYSFGVQRCCTVQESLQKAQQSRMGSKRHLEIYQSTGRAHATVLDNLEEGDGYLQAALQGITQVLCDLVHPNAAHRSHSQRPDERVGVLRVLHKSHLALPLLSQCPNERTEVLRDLHKPNHALTTSIAEASHRRTEPSKVPASHRMNLHHVHHQIM